MSDIARSTGVSTKTVSRVINGLPGASPETRAKVLDAASGMGFRRNDLARDLRANQITPTVGVVIEDLANPFYGEVQRAMVDVASRSGAMIITTSSDESPEREREVVLSLCARRIAGLCLVTTRSDHGYLVPEIASGLPVVFLDRPALDLEVDTVLLDNVGGAASAVTHLVSHGHRRIAAIGDHEHIHTVRSRLEGYERALRDHGIEIDPQLQKLGRHSTIDAAAATHEMLALPSPPTAFFGLNNRATVGIVRAMRDRGQQRAVIGFDDFELADLLSVPVTVVTYDPALLGRRSAEFVISRINGDDSPKKEIILPTRLVPRGSGELHPY